VAARSKAGICGLESHQEHGRLSLASFVFFQVEVSATDRSLIQRSSTESGVSECDRSLDSEEALAHWGAVAQ